MKRFIRSSSSQESALQESHEARRCYTGSVMNGRKATCALSPFDSQLRTLVRASRRSAFRANLLTHAPQQTRRPEPTGVAKRQTSSRLPSGKSFVFDCANDRREYGAASASRSEEHT